MFQPWEWLNHRIKDKGGHISVQVCRTNSDKGIPSSSEARQLYCLQVWALFLLFYVKIVDKHLLPGDPCPRVADGVSWLQSSACLISCLAGRVGRPHGSRLKLCCCGRTSYIASDSVRGPPGPPTLPPSVVGLWSGLKRLGHWLMNMTMGSGSTLKALTNLMWHHN